MSGARVRIGPGTLYTALSTLSNKERRFQDYMTLYTDAGWVYVSSYGNGWH